MKKDFHYYRIFLSAASVKEARLVHENGKAAEGPKEEEKPKEGEKSAPETAEAARSKFEEQKKSLEDKIKKNLTHPNPTVREAARKANDDLSKLGESKNLSPEQVVANLNKITSVITYFETIVPGIEKERSRVHEKAKELIDRIDKAFSTSFKPMLAKYPELSDEAMKQLEKVKNNYIQKQKNKVGDHISNADAYVNALSLDMYIKHPTILDTMKETIRDQYYKELDLGGKLQSDVTHWAAREYIAEIEAVVAVDYGKRGGNLDQLVKFEVERARKQLGRYDSIQKDERIRPVQRKQLDDIEKNTAALLQMLNKPSDANQRAVVLANMYDQIRRATAALTLDDQEKYNSQMAEKGKAAEFQSTESALARLGYKKDKYQAAFEKGNVYSGISGVDLYARKEKSFQTKGNVNFRLEGSGMRITTLPPGSKVQVLDSSTWHIEQKDGEKTDYVKVRLNPPDGPAGYIAANYIDFKKEVPPPVKKETPPEGQPPKGQV